MKKYILILWLCLWWGYGTYAQVLQLTDAHTGEPIENATISSRALNVYDMSNANGQVNMQKYTGAADIEIRVLGYQSALLSYADLAAYNYLLKLTPTLLTIDQVTVSAMRWNLNKKDVPVKIQSISSKDVNLQAPQTAADLLNLSGAVFMQKSQMGGGSPMIRGFAANKLLYVVDGIRMNTAIFRSGNIQNVISIDPYLLESSEIVFGPGSVLYGSDALGGVMNFKTITPAMSIDSAVHISGNADFRYSSANSENTYHLTLHAAMPGWGSATVISFSDFDNLQMGIHGPQEYLSNFYVQHTDSADMVVKNNNPHTMQPTAYSQINIAQKLKVRINSHTDLDYGFIFSTTSDFARFDRLYLLRNGLPRSAQWYYGPQIWLMNYLSLDVHATEGMFDEMTVRLAHQFFEESRNDRNFGSSILKNRVEHVQAYSLNLDFIKNLSTRHVLLYGAEAVVNDVTSEGTDINIRTNTSSGAASRYPNSVWQSYAVYANWQYKPVQQLSFNLGARYNAFHIKSDFDTTYFPFPYTQASLQFGSGSGNAGILYTPAKNTAIAINFASGFRAPNVDDIGKLFDSAPGVLVVPNTKLTAEYVYSAEFSLTQMLGDWVKAEAGAFYSYLDGAMVRRPFSLNGADSILYDGVPSKVEAIQNAAFATVYGVYAAIEMRLPLGFQLVSNINYQKGEEELEDGSTSPSRHAAPLFGSTHLYFSHSILKADLYARYAGTKSFDQMPQEEIDKAYMYAADGQGNPYAPAWYTINLKLLVKATDKAHITLGIENISNRLYRPYSSGISAPGRNFQFGVKAMF